MDPINEAHVSEPGGLVVVDVAAADDATALAFQQLLADRWATATAEHTTRDARRTAALLLGPAPIDQPDRAERAHHRSRTTVTTACRIVPATTSTTTSPATGV
ncbi:MULTISPECIES: DUF6207 family protein [unclassified Streptomyces]|uniref:DUF6207 family protein n=1 Tax=unclassified Streptomyces TaxID=2593676 RepID=UPI001F486F7B|nr:MULTISPECIES: DUF6207 family protein [unclassified Streptomyces]WSB24474.1 DUF6207 family protein [Streptomyces sp. NBC_01788]WSB30974.1 DUF6207 family protein [Streptomyces sp. NBC_01788]